MTPIAEKVTAIRSPNADRRSFLDQTKTSKMKSRPAAAAT